MQCIKCRLYESVEFPDCAENDEDKALMARGDVIMNVADVKIK